VTRARGWPGAWGLTVLGIGGCVMVPNPNHVAEGESETFADTDGGTDHAGDGDGDSPGDGDGSPPGDGDGDPPGDGDGSPPGDGDGDGPCLAGQEGCPCAPLATCDPGLACVLGVCYEASSCDPVNDAVALSYSATWAGDPFAEPPVPPMAPTTPEVFICVLSGQQVQGAAVLTIHQCGDAAQLQQLVLQISPIVAPIAELLDTPNLAATVYVVEKPEGVFVRVNAKGMDYYYIDGTSLFAEGITAYPWAISPFSSACGQTPTLCGTLERLALLVDGGIVFDGNVGQPSAKATVWAKTIVDDCDTQKFKVGLLAY